MIISFIKWFVFLAALVMFWCFYMLASSMADIILYLLRRAGMPGA